MKGRRHLEFELWPWHFAMKDSTLTEKIRSGTRRMSLRAAKVARQNFGRDIADLDGYTDATTGPLRQINSEDTASPSSSRGLRVQIAKQTASS